MVTIPVTVLPLAKSSILSFVLIDDVITVAAAPTSSETLPNAPKPLVLLLSNDNLSPIAYPLPPSRIFTLSIVPFLVFFI